MRLQGLEGARPPTGEGLGWGARSGQRQVGEGSQWPGLERFVDIVLFCSFMGTLGYLSVLLN